MKITNAEYPMLNKEVKYFGVLYPKFNIRY